MSNSYNLYSRRTKTFVWNVNNNSTSNLVSTVMTAVDGLQNWSIIYNNGVGLTNYSRTDYDPANGLMIGTSVGADGAYSVGTSQFGRQVSVVRYDANGGQLGRTDYGYDAQGRPNAVTDARNGTFSSYFNAADQATAGVTPSPDGVQAGQLTTNLLDSLGRVVKTILPDGAGVTNLYATYGALTNNFGSRTYATGDGYDYAGRMKTLTTWTNFGTKTGA